MVVTSMHEPAGQLSREETHVLGPPAVPEN